MKTIDILNSENNKLKNNLEKYKIQVKTQFI